MKKTVALWIVFALLVGSLGAAGAVAWQALNGSDRDTRDSGGAGGSGGAGAAEDLAKRERDPGPAPKGLETFYDQKLSWKDCDGGECATLTVPLDYRTPDGTTIDLALLKVPASGTAIGSLVVNPGGPGAPGTDYAAAAGQVFGQRLLQSYDVVGFDPRGTGDSAPVDCVSDAGLDRLLAGDPTPDDPAEQKALLTTNREFAAGCRRNSPKIAPRVSTVEAAKDMDVLRAALGLSKLDYLGASYGTKLGATYADLFPQRAGRMVLDGAVDPQLSSRELALGQAKGFQTALNAYADDCVAQGGCALGSDRASVLDAISGLLQKVDREPLEAGDRELTVGSAFYGLVTPLYQQQAWPMLTAALQSAIQQGDGRQLLTFADLYASRNADGSYENNSSEAIAAINCTDDPWRLAPGKVKGELAAFRKASPTFGDVFAWGLTACAGFPEKTPYARHQVQAKGADPILVVGTSRDPATPVEWSRSLAEQLDSGVLIERDGDGHTGYNAGNACVDTAVEDYLLKGTVPKDGLTC